MQGNPIPTPEQIGAQHLDADLTALAGLSPNTNNFIVGNGFAWSVQSGAMARASLGIPDLGNWTTLTLTFGAKFSQNGIGAHPNRIRVNEFLRLVMVEFSVGTGVNNPADGDIIFSWSSAYALPASPAFKYCNISYADVVPYPHVYVDGATIKFQQVFSPDGAISFLIGNAIYIY